VETLVVEEILSKLVYHKVVTLEAILVVTQVVAVELTLVDPQTQLQEQDKALVDLVMVKDQDKVLDKV
jgi:hypothetical protein